MQASLDHTEFQKQWLQIAEKVCERIYEDPEIQNIKQAWETGTPLSYAQKSDFIAVCNRVKYQCIRDHFGIEGTSEFDQFKKAWRNWFDNKGKPGFMLESRGLTNAEHIVFSSTPDPDEFFRNFKS